MTTLRFLGAAGTVTGSRHLLDAGTARVMVDCGLFQGTRALRDRNWAKLPIAARDVDSVILTHGHIDHCGYLPRFVADGFQGPVRATADTAALVSIVLPDSARLQEEEAAHANEQGYSKHAPALPLYDTEDAERALELLRVMPHGDRREVAPGITATLATAGHILGSSTVRVELGGTSVVFSGDLGRPSHPLLLPPAPVGEADWIVVESTYGDRHHDEVSDAAGLLDTIVRTVARGGTVVIPAFAVDRTEILLYHLDRMAELGELPDVPIYVDSPMALAALRVYRAAVRARSAEIRPDVAEDPTPFLEGRLREIRSVEESKALTATDQPKVIIAASGMATGGRVVHHLARFLEDPRSSVVLVGYQAAGTRGQLLLAGARELKMLGRYVRVRADVVNLPAFSVHADADEIIGWLRTSSRRPKGVFLVHGEPGPARVLADRIEDELDWTAVIPHMDEIVRL
ncbi:MAG: MBL fold metallo-hydrolase [Chloroflexi bacterium]|nr:MBL fold metallo-hydrolase [Chloroflexota bacterium]